MCGLKTPDYSHLGPTDFQDVYEPAEDTFLLLDALEKDAKLIRSIRPCVCVEVGSGSGVVITFLAQLLNNFSMCLGVDRNPKAATSTKRTAEQNGVKVEVLNSDLLSALQPRLHGKVDVLVFNPPYVVTSSEEVESSSIASSWAGGKDGREVLDRLLPHVAKLLSAEGVFYLLLIKENNPDEVEQILAAQKLSCEVVLERRAGPEHLSVLRFLHDSKR
ncbi:hemK methyltransferase family member 2-like [Acanthaster planci]|uniref:Methyltransferase HEMK2 n=1 Tax=Acanthaster planci TaxID=133434 RepID=A0A8B7ZFT6_ACAPL|nr:hemK methyltransferase family member 2-like [Acanthaster planci]XP_022104518.1 hemK methyltransferase family member 2-like [Acanthaster planci]